VPLIPLRAVLVIVTEVNDGLSVFVRAIPGPVVF